MRTSTSPGSKSIRLFPLLGVASAVASFAAATALETPLSGTRLLSWLSRASHNIPHHSAFAAIALFWMFFNLLGNRRETPKHKDLIRRIALWVLAAAIVIYALTLRDVNVLFLGCLFLAFAAVAARGFYVRNYIGVTSAESQPAAPQAVVVGAREEADPLVKLLAGRHAYAGVSVCDPSELETLQPRPNERLDMFVLASAQYGGTVERALPQFVRNGAKVHLVPALFETLAFRCKLNQFEGVPLVTLEQGEIKPRQLFLKRAMDIVGSLLLIIIATPAMLLIAAAIKLTSKGPVLFAHKRLGRNGKPLMVYKFRTMRTDAEDLLKRKPELYAEYVKHNYKLPPELDFRVTSLGRFLRASSLDELPQLLNVLGGGMSLVGPRPIVPEEIVEYGSYGYILLSVKPGVTGQWQVSGRSTIRDYQQRVRLDLEYIRDQSLAKDLAILFRTMGAVRRMEGAY